MQTIMDDIQRVSRYCRRAGTDNRFMFQFTNKITDMQISVTKRINPFRDGVALVYYEHKDIKMMNRLDK